MDGFYPEEVLCTLGQDAKGRHIIFPWCIDWVQCIHREAEPSGTPEAVLKAWAPATCEEICGHWPVQRPTKPPTTTTTAPPSTTTVKAATTTEEPTTQMATTTKPKCPPWVDGDCDMIMDEMEGEMGGEMDEMEGEMEDLGEMEGELEFVHLDNMKRNRTSLRLDFLSMGFKKKQKKSECMVSCENWKRSFSTCVATIIFEPGKLANMGMAGKGDLRDKVPEICLQKETPCMPELAIHHQRCIHHRTHSILNADYHVTEEVYDTCKHIEEDFDQCKECPQLSENYKTQYAALTGGCLDQMHAYRQSTTPLDPNYGIPRESGCSLSQ